MRAQAQRLGVLGLELGHQPRPQCAGGAHLGDLHVEVHPDRPEEAQPRRERIDVEADVEARADVLDTVGQRVRELEVVRGPGFLDVVAGDRDRVEPRHLLRGVREDVGDDPHRRRRRVDVGVADHELFEDVVLDRARQLLGRHALLLGRDDVQREDRQHRTVHRHRHAHLVERDALEQLAGVVDRVDRDTGHADVADDPRVVGVVAAVGRQVEGDRQALLAGRQVAAVERVGLLGGREARVLADRPRLRRVHRGVRSAQVRRQPGIGVQRVEALEVLGGVEPLDVDALGCCPRLGPVGRPRIRLGVGLVRLLGIERQTAEALGDRAHLTSSSRIERRKASASTPIAMVASAPLAGPEAGSLPARTTYVAPTSRSAATRSAPHCW